MEDGCMPEELNVEEASQSEIRTPEPTMDRPTGMRQVVRCPAPAHFHDRNFVALFHQAMGRNTATESRTDDDEVEIEFLQLVHTRHPWNPTRTETRSRKSGLG